MDIVAGHSCALGFAMNVECTSVVKLTKRDLAIAERLDESAIVLLVQ